MAASSLLSAMFGRRRPALIPSSQRSPPPHAIHPLRDNTYPPKSLSRRRNRLLFLLLRYVRRPVVLVILFGVALWFVGVLQEWFSGSRGRPTDSGMTPDHAITPPAFKFDDRILTVTKTAVIHSTETVTVAAENPTGTSIAKDVFGFPIVSPASPSQLLDPPSHQHASTAHFYREDGLLEVNPSGPHPIFELIRRAEQRWDEKHSKASTTLKQAYVEYQRRYGRLPPKGFDVWWTYVQSHLVQLPDEYDQIDRDLAPFWGVEPTHLRRTQRDWEAQDDTFTVGKDVAEDLLGIVNYTSPADERVRHEQAKGANFVVDVLAEVEDYLPPFRAVFTPHDNPSLHSDWELRDEALNAAKHGKYIDSKKEREHKLHGWKSSCNPFSPAWVDPIPYSPYHPPLSEIFALKYKSPYAQSTLPSKTFIYDHRASMDPCLHPSHLLSHGQFLSHGTGPVPHRTLIPQFGYSPTTLHDDITVALPFNWVEDVLPRSNDPPFSEKEDSRLHWRGRNTGIWHGREDQVIKWSDELQLGKVLENPELHGNLWWLSQRERLVDWANKMKEDVVPRPGVHHGKDAKGQVEEFESGIPVEMRLRPQYEGEDPTPREDSDVYPKVKSSKARALGSTPNDLWAVGEQSQEVLKAKWAPGMADIAFAGEPINCEGRACDRLKEVYEFRKFHDGKTQGRYRYVMDVDGNGWSSRFKRLITSNAVIFKSTIYPEWYTDRVAPWVHYVPIQNDLSDLLDTLYFFRGDSAGNNAHEDLAEKIAVQGREWSLKYWRMADMTAYTFRLFLEYARVMSEDRDVKEEVEMDRDIVWDAVRGGVTGDQNGKVAVKVGKQDYVYREEDEYVPAAATADGKEAASQREWDWKYRQMRVVTTKEGS